jgi:hypothetical protein
MIVVAGLALISLFLSFASLISCERLAGIIDSYIKGHPREPGSLLDSGETFDRNCLDNRAYYLSQSNRSYLNLPECLLCENPAVYIVVRKWNFYTLCNHHLIRKLRKGDIKRVYHRRDGVDIPKDIIRCLEAETEK